MGNGENIEKTLENLDDYEKSGHFYKGGEHVFAVIKKPVHYSYQPLPDITTWELAQVIHTNMKVQFGRYLTQEEYDALPAGVKRHLPLID